MNRNLTIITSVVVFHVAALWALQSGLVRRTIESVVPAEILSQLLEPPAPKTVPPPPPVLPRQTQAKSAKPTPAPPPPLMAIADPTPAPNAPVGVTTPQPLPPPITAPVAAAVPPAPPASQPPSPKVELPSSDADYLQNPRPPYPPISKRLGEQGKVMVRVFIGVDGTAQKAELRQSSGYERLDQVALNTVLKWHYIPGKRGGVPEAMWFVVPINFVLE